MYVRGMKQYNTLRVSSNKCIQRLIISKSFEK